MKALYEIRNGYLYVKISGEFDLSAAQEITIQWINMARTYDLNRVLCDITLVKGYDAKHVPPASQLAIPRFVIEQLPQDVWLSILKTPLQNISAQMNEYERYEGGDRIRVTTSLNEALEWLGMA